MGLRIVEFFGFSPLSESARNYIADRRCPFTETSCIKPEHGSCSIRQVINPEPIICCANRLYGDDFAMLGEIARQCFGEQVELVSRSEAVKRLHGESEWSGQEVVAFGKGWGGELPLPKPTGKNAKGKASYYMDWVLAKLNQSGEIEDFTAVEVQTIDTSGSYNEVVEAFSNFREFEGFSETGGLNWENVNKRILPQVIYKGHVLRREEKCKNGLFFVCPKQVYERIIERLGGDLHEYPIGPGTITFRSYEVGAPNPDNTYQLDFHAQFTTTVDQVALAFTSPRNLPNTGVYSDAIMKALGLSSST